MKRASLVVAGLSLLLAGSFAGCSWSVGSGGTKHNVQSPTTGQQLIDLKKARDAGAITDQEYEAQKNKLLSK
jgi:hypothetical protein